jgi:glucokinase
MALGGPFDKKFQERGCYEHYASGDGIARFTRELLDEDLHYSGILRNQTKETLTAHHVFAAYDKDDALAVKVIEECIEFWGMASANLISIFNPQKIIFGGGVFGPAIKFIPRILSEAKKWAQPVSAAKVRFEKSALDGNATIYGAGFLAMKNLGGT